MLLNRLVQSLAIKADLAKAIIGSAVMGSIHVQLRSGQASTYSPKG